MAARTDDEYIQLATDYLGTSILNNPRADKVQFGRDIDVYGTDAHGNIAYPDAPLTYTEDTYKAAQDDIAAFHRRLGDLLWTMADADEHTRLTNRLSILTAFFKVL